MGLLAAAVFAKLWGPLPLGIALVCAVASGALLGVLVQVLVMRPLRHSSPLTRLVATLGLFVFLQQLVSLRYSSGVVFIGSVFPVYAWKPGGLVIASDRLLIFIVAVLTTILLWALYRYTTFGRATSAVAENERAAASLGHSPMAVAIVNWAIGGALSALAAILVLGIMGLDPVNLPLLVIPALAAALIGRFVSFPLSLLGGVIIGIAQSEVTEYVSSPGWSDAVPFLVIIALVVLSGRALPQRSYLQDRLPELGTGRIRVGWLTLGVAAWVALCFAFTSSWTDAVTSTMIGGTVCLSLVVITGYCGQISLAQFAIAGVGAFISARLAAVFGLPFFAVMAIAIVATIPIGLAVALPALRTRGVNLAVVTIGLALTIDQLLLNNTNYTGGLAGTIVKPPSIFGLSLNATTHSNRYAILSTLVFVLSGVLVANVRRGASGRRLLAVRANERAAASLGVSVTGAKLYAFGLAAALAAAAGTLSAFRSPFVDFTVYGGLQSITAVIDAVIGGVGFIFGGFIGGTFADQGFNQEILGHWGNLANYVTIASGALLIVVLIFNRNGLAWNNTRFVSFAEKRLWRLSRHGVTEVQSELESQEGPAPLLPILPHLAEATPVSREARPSLRNRPVRTLAVDNVAVAFGGVQALHNVSLSVCSGEVVGLIGPNGAGKTALLDVISGITRRYQGSVSIDGRAIDSWTPHARARAGIGRASQSLDLFEDQSVLDNLRTACDTRSRRIYFSDLVWSAKTPLPGPVREAVDELGIAPFLASRPGALSYGRRRLVAIARALAIAPSILLLDEPAAGLDDRNTANLGRLVRHLADNLGIGVLLVEHDMPLVLSVCDRVVTLNFGEMIASGTPEQVRSAPAVVAAYLGGATEPAEVCTS